MLSRDQVVDSCHSPSRLSDARRKFRGFGNHYSLFRQGVVWKLRRQSQSRFLHGGRLGRRQGPGYELGRGHCEVRLENETSVSLSQYLCCGSCDIVGLCVDRFSCWRIAMRMMPVPCCKVVTAWCCNRSSLTVGSGFPSRNCPSVC